MLKDGDVFLTFNRRPDVRKRLKAKLFCQKRKKFGQILCEFDRDFERKTHVINQNLSLNWSSPNVYILPPLRIIFVVFGGGKPNYLKKSGEKLPRTIVHHFSWVIIRDTTTSLPQSSTRPSNISSTKKGELLNVAECLAECGVEWLGRTTSDG